MGIDFNSNFFKNCIVSDVSTVEEFREKYTKPDRWSDDPFWTEEKKKECYLDDYKSLEKYGYIALSHHDSITGRRVIFLSSTKKIKDLKKRFEIQVTKLKKLGFIGEVVLAPGSLMIVAHNKDSSSLMRKVFKMSKEAKTGIVNEFRFGDKSVFCWVDDELVMSKKERREIALKLAS